MRLIRHLAIFLVILNSIVRLNAQTFSGTGGSILITPDTSRFPINVIALTPSTLDFTFGLESVQIYIQHNRCRDIDCFLAAPDGTLIELTTDNGNTGANFTGTVFRHDAPTSIVNGSAPFASTYKPEGDLWRINNGQAGTGLWELRIVDDVNNGISGSLTSWNITFGINPASTVVFSSSALPVVSINTFGQTIPDDPKIIAQMGIIDNGPGQRNHITDPFNGYNGRIAIEKRGSSQQLFFPKHSYGFETRDMTGMNDSDVTLLGMPLEHDWILSANYTDKSFCRNILAYRLAEEMGHYAARTRMVDVLLNGEYIGMYVLTEKLKRDDNRLDISKLNPTEVSWPNVSGGYIIKIDKLTGSGGAGWTSPYPPINHPNGQTIYYQYDYPQPDSIVPAQMNYIRSYVDSFESALAGPNFMDSLLGYSQYIGNNSFIDLFIMNELSKNVDGYRISTYLYKDKGKTLKAGPVWDYDIAFGNADYCGGDLTYNWAYQFLTCESSDQQIPFWWPRLLQDSSFANQLKCRWQKFRSGILSTNHINAIIDSVALVVDESKDWNFSVWPILGTYVWPNPSPIPSDYAGEIAKLKTWISNRIAWLDANLPGNCNCSVSVSQLPVSCVGACDGELMAASNSNYQVTYTWSIGSNDPVVQGICPGSYTLTMEDAVGCTRTVITTLQDPLALTVQLQAVPASCMGCSDGSAAAVVAGGVPPYSFQWINAGSDSLQLSGVMAGRYVFCVSDTNGCLSCDSIDIPDGPVGVVEFSENNLVQVYPNPAQDQVVFKFKMANPEKTEMKLFNSSGQCVAVLSEELMQRGLQTRTLDVSTCPPGVYSWILLAGGQFKSGRLVILR